MSSKLCAATELGIFTLSSLPYYYPVSSSNEPRSPALKDQWCALRATATISNTLAKVHKKAGKTH